MLDDLTAWRIDVDQKNKYFQSYDLPRRCQNCVNADACTIKIPVYNPANKDIKLQRKTIIGQLEFISVAVQVEIKQSKFPEVNEIKICEDSSK